jgi:hypothetical protein
MRTVPRSEGAPKEAPGYTTHNESMRYIAVMRFVVRIGKLCRR